MNFDFDWLPKGISILAQAGGVVTAVVAIATLQYWSSHGTTGGDTGWYYWHKHLEDSLSYVGTQWHPAPAQ